MMEEQNDEEVSRLNQVDVQVKNKNGDLILEALDLKKKKTSEHKPVAINLPKEKQDGVLVKEEERS
jgi:4-diphosphocytidyl-2C-methyl-D-erythritol kinase